MTVIDEIASERRRQVEDEGWTLEHDDEHRTGEMAFAAAVYTRHAADDRSHRVALRMRDEGFAPRHWPWDEFWFKPQTRRRDLIRAAALIVAEIERLDRAEPQP